MRIPSNFYKKFTIFVSTQQRHRGQLAKQKLYFDFVFRRRSSRLHHGAAEYLRKWWIEMFFSRISFL
jgi:hypothetical protein